MSKWRLPLVLGAFLALLLCGCNNVKQINRITFVTALGIEPTENGVLVHALAAIPGNYSALSPGSGSGAGIPPNYIISQEGRTISDALYQMKRKTARDIQFGHTKIILFSDQLAESGLANHLDFLLRREEFQMIAWIAVTKGSPKTLLSINPAVPQSVGDWMVDVFSQAGSDTFEVLPIHLFEFFGRVHEPGISPYAMVLEPSPQKKNVIVIDKIALFHRDRLAGYLDAAEVKYVSMLQQKDLLPTGFTITRDKMSFVMLDYKTKIRWAEDRMKIAIDIKLDFDQSSTGRATSKEDIAKIEAKLNDLISDKISSLIDELKRLKSDPIGFGEKYRVAHGGELDNEEWLEKLFPQMEADIQVNAKIQRRGMIE